jgi:hypothetical protein
MARPMSRHRSVASEYRIYVRISSDFSARTVPILPYSALLASDSTPSILKPQRTPRIGGGRRDLGQPSKPGRRDAGPPQGAEHALRCHPAGLTVAGSLGTERVEANGSRIAREKAAPRGRHIRLLDRPSRALGARGRPHVVAMVVR